MSIWWSILDPLLLRFRARLEHLSSHRPSSRFEDELRLYGSIDSTVKLGGDAEINNPWPANLTVGPFCWLLGTFHLLTPEAKLEVGHHSYFGPGSTVSVQTRVAVGSHVFIANYVDILDTDAHSLNWRKRQEETIELFEHGRPWSYDSIRSAAITIEDDVWIGAKATVLKGVTIGRGAIVGANSVVNRDVEPFTLVAGTPAKEIRKLDRST